MEKLIILSKFIKIYNLKVKSLDFPKHKIMIKYDFIKIKNIIIYYNY